MSVDTFLRDTAKQYSEKVVIYFGNTEITYGQLDREVDNISQGLLDLGLKHHQRVGVLLGNCPDFIRAYFAVTRAGGTVIPLNPLFKGEEIKYILNDAEVVFLITTQSFFPVIDSIWSQIPTLQKVIPKGSRRMPLSTSQGC